MYDDTLRQVGMYLHGFSLLVGVLRWRLQDGKFMIAVMRRCPFVAENVGV
jgi:hypothetical protein